MSIETMTKIATYTLGSSSSTITFDNIPQTYTDLKLMVSARGDTTNSDIGITGVQTHYLRINGNLGTLHTSRYLYGNGATATSSTVSGETIWRAPGSTNSSVTASTFSNSELYIPNYTSNNYKTAGFDMVTENNSTTAGQFMSAFLYAGTESITKIEILASSGNFVANSTFTLYGVKAMRTAVGNSIKATGGAISFDGTYVYHTFNSTDVFTPTASITADYLVVAGGGGGGSRRGSGGGAGRVQQGTATLSASPYNVTVGAGGAGGASGSANTGAIGNSSIFNSLTSLYGNGGGTDGAAGGTSGASFAGGSTGGGPNYGAGGGGGSSAVGGNGTTTVAGNGGAGTTSSYSGTSITYGGGGGGGTYDGGTPGTGTDGGGNGGSGANPGTAGSAATANKGGGGGGGGHYSASGGGAAGGAGGSGVVIVRYRA